MESGIDAPVVRGRADSGDIEIDLVELLTDVGGLAADLGKGVAVFIDEMQDLGPDDVSALCAACHEISQSGLPVIVVGAGLPHLPAVLCASKSYSERLFPTSASTGSPRRGRPRADRPRRRGGRGVRRRRAGRDVLATGGYPYFIQAYGKAVVGPRAASPITAADVAVAAPEAERELAVGFFGSRYERATPGERDYLRAMADVAGPETPTTRWTRSPPPSGRRAGQEAAVAVAGAGLAAQEGAHLLRGARPDRVHGAALRPLPAPPRLRRRVRMAGNLGGKTRSWWGWGTVEDAVTGRGARKLTWRRRGEAPERRARVHEAPPVEPLRRRREPRFGRRSRSRALYVGDP